MEGVAKAIGDLAELIQAVFTALPPSRPWQRQLLQQLAEIDRQLQVLRLTIVMNRGSHEVKEAGEQLRTTLRVAQRYVSSGRADLGTRAAVLLACALGQRIDTALE